MRAMSPPSSGTGGGGFGGGGLCPHWAEALNVISKSVVITIFLMILSYFKNVLMVLLAVFPLS
jgi:hypothetical protein